MTPMMMIKPTAPPTPAAIAMSFVLSLFCDVSLTGGVVVGVVIDVIPDVVTPDVVTPDEVTPDEVTPDAGEAVGVGPEADILELEADNDVEDVVLALVLAPNTAPCKVNTAFSVLQHLCLSASLSQQYFASSA
jgi:hypothetical protein